MLVGEANRSISESCIVYLHIKITDARATIPMLKKNPATSETQPIGGAPGWRFRTAGRANNIVVATP